MTQKYFKRNVEGSSYDVLQFTGDNRAETRAFFGNPIVIRQGKFYAGPEMGYVTNSDWLVRDAQGKMSKVDNINFVKDYWPL